MGSKFRKFIFPLRQLRLSFLISFSLGPGSAVEEKGKKRLTGSNKAVVWGGERATPLSPPQTSSLFSPNAEPGPGLQFLMLRIFHVLVKSISRRSNI